LLKRSVSVELKKTLQKMYDNGEYLAEHLQGALPAISLGSNSAFVTSYINDAAPDMVFAQQVYAYLGENDLLLALSTSGNSRNVINAIKVAKSLGAAVLGITGKDGGIMGELCDCCIKLPAKETYRVQEYMQVVYQALCAMVELHFFG